MADRFRLNGGPDRCIGKVFLKQNPQEAKSVYPDDGMSVPKIKFIVTFHIYSGRTDPKWIVDENNPKHAEVLFRIGDIRTCAFDDRLGYRGFTIKCQNDSLIDDKYRFDLAPIQLCNQPEMELLFLSTAPEGFIQESALTHAQKVISEKVDHKRWFKAPRVRDPATSLPAYEPQKWNCPNHMVYNNCYNYANNIITDTNALPGRKTHMSIPVRTTGQDIKNCAISDGLVAIMNPDPDHLPDSEWNLIALVFWPPEKPGDTHFDYHFYRLDDNRQWSHKPGETPAIETDNVGKPIFDPRYCNRGPYSEFVTFMQTLPARVSIV